MTKEWILKFWEEQHKTSNLKNLSGYNGKTVWKELKIEDRIKQGNKVLNIGVGFGYCTKDLFDKGMIVTALDIVPNALEKVKEWTERTYLDNQIQDLPPDTYNLAISHLVAQHMNTEDLTRQMTNVIRSIKDDGLFAIQFSEYIKPTTLINNETYIDGLGLQFCRHISDMDIIIRKSGGKVKNIFLIDDYPKFNIRWYGVHITK